MKFKQFEIRKPTLVVEPPEDYYNYNFDLVKWNDEHTCCWSIASLRWDKKEPCFRFESCGTRYLSSREDGLEEWLLKWCELKEIEYSYEENI